MALAQAGPRGEYFTGAMLAGIGREAMSDMLTMAAGLLLLVAGAEMLVRSSTFIAARLGVPPLLVGLTIVAFGTSAPETVASVAAALRQSPGIALGNIVGSNITNGLLVAGAAALITPLAVTTAALRRDGSVALLAAIALWVICLFGALNAASGAALVLALLLYVVYSYRQEAGSGAGGAAYSRDAVRGEAGRYFPATRLAVPAAVLGCVTGTALLAFGGHLLVDAAVALAADLGVSEAVVGLTIVAVGTSLPELVTSVLAALRRETDIAVGNVIGSNIFNVLGIGGLTAMLSQGAVPTRIVTIDFPIMLAATGLLLVFAATGRRIGRLEGLLLVCAFGLYLGSVWLVGN